MFTTGAHMDSNSIPASDLSRARELADALDCLLEPDICTLYKITPHTAEAWRKRHRGPEYILAGNRFLYPKKAVARDLQERARVRTSGDGKAVL
jgi:hypothetical protein